MDNDADNRNEERRSAVEAVNNGVGRSARRRMHASTSRSKPLRPIKDETWLKIFRGRDKLAALLARAGI